MPEMHLKQPGFTYSACRPFTNEWKNSKKKKKHSRHIYQKELVKASFQRDIDYGDFKDLPRRAASDKVLHDKAFNIAKNQKYDGCLRGLASMVYLFIFFDKKFSGGAVTRAEKSALKTYLTDMQLISKYVINK